MIIGTVRPEEARIFDSMEGYHEFHADETQEPYGSFEIFWDDADVVDEHTRNFDNAGIPVAPGWYWWACSPGCLPDGDPCGPFATSREAHEDADEWSPEYNPTEDTPC